MQKQSKKSEIAQQKAQAKIKQALEKNNTELAKSYAQEAIRHKGEAQRYRVLGSKIDAMYSKLNQAYKSQQLTNTMRSLVDKMTGVSNIADVTQMMKTMEDFETMFDNIDVQDKMVNDVMNNVNAGTVNDVEVDELIDQIQQGNAFKLEDNMVNAQSNQIPGQQIYNPQQKDKIENFFP